MIETSPRRRVTNPARAWKRRAAPRRRDLPPRGLARDAAGAERGVWPRIPRRYAWLFGGALGAVLLYYGGVNPHHRPAGILCLAGLTWLLAGLPMLAFLGHGRVHQVPALEAHGLFYAVCFGYAGFLPVPVLGGVAALTDADVARALACASAGLAALATGYYVLGPRLGRNWTALHPGRRLLTGSVETWGWMASAAGLAAEQIGRLLHTSALGQVAGMLFLMGFYILLTSALQGRGSRGSRAAVFFGLLPLVVLTRSGLSTGQLAGLVVLACWTSLVVLRTRQRIPLWLLAGGAVLFLVFQPVKFYVRSLAWGDGITLGPWETLQVYREGFRQTYGSGQALWARRGAAFQSSFTRINHLATTAAILRDTPVPQPFRWGRTYLPLLTKWIPRAVWPGKPEERLGNDWARQYGMLGADDTTTSFNLPWLPEMFMNFGWAGVVGIMLALGVVYRLFWASLLAHPATTVEYATALTFAQSLVFAESHLSLQLGGPIIFAVLLWLVGQGLRLTGIGSPAGLRPKTGRAKRPGQSRRRPGLTGPPQSVVPS